MRVRGEAFLLLNGGMNYLSLLAAARLGRRRLRPLRGAAAALAGAVYAVIAWQEGAAWRSAGALALAGLAMTAIAFGPGAVRMLLLAAVGALTLAGGAEALLSRQAGPWEALALGGALTACVCLAGRFGGAREGANMRIILNGKTLDVPILKDSGNLLRCGAAGLPVVAVPAALLTPILPPGVKPEDLSTLPRGWRLLRFRTAAGEKTAMCFYPDALEILRGGRARRAEAAVMIAPAGGRFALVPDELFRADPRKEGTHAGV